MIRNRDELDGDPDRELALDCVVSGIRAADPAAAVSERVSCEDCALVVDGERYDLAAYDRVLVVGGGKAAAVVASALESVLDAAIDGGIVVTDRPVETDRVSIRPGDHPVPSGRGVDSTGELLSAVEAAGPDDLVIAVVTGGASALLPAPAAGLDLEDLRTTTEALLASGAGIEEVNAVRKHLSGSKGGRLAATAHPATVLGLVVSDVVGDRLDVIGSGPLSPDDSSFAEAREVLERHAVDVPAAVATRLDRGADGAVPETPGPDHPAFDRVTHRVLADGTTALAAAAQTAREAGYEPLVLGDRIRGEAREAARTMVGIAESVHEDATPVEPPAVLLSGGETTVTVRGDGEGGPNQEFVLSAALELAVPGVTVACVDTDGIDGDSGAAGAIGTRETAEPVADARAALADNDAGGFLRRRGATIEMGPTDTNVNDLRVVVISGESTDPSMR